MAKATQDYTKIFTDFLGTLPTDFSSVQDVFKNQAVLAEKLSKVALTAAEQSADLSNKWTRDTLARLGTVTKAQDDAAAYGKAATDFASSSVEVAAEQMAAFAEVAKKAQTETIELLLASGKQATEEATAAVKKATADVTAAAKKATAVAPKAAA